MASLDASSISRVNSINRLHSIALGTISSNLKNLSLNISTSTNDFYNDVATCFTRREFLVDGIEREPFDSDVWAIHLVNRHRFHLEKV